MTDETVEEFLARGGRIKQCPPGSASFDDLEEDPEIDVSILRPRGHYVKGDGFTMFVEAEWRNEKKWKEFTQKQRQRLYAPTRQRTIGYDDLFVRYDGWIPALPDMDGHWRGRGDV